MSTRVSIPYAAWADQSAPDLSNLLRPLRIDAKAFSQWLGPRLAQFRHAREYGASLPSLKEEREQLRALLEAIDVVVDSLQHDALPPRTLTRLEMLLHRHQLDSSELTGRVRRDISVLRGALGAVEKDLAAAEGRRGRPAADAQRELLRAVAEKLAELAPAANAPVRHEKAAEILNKCLPRSGFPTDAPSIQRAIRQVKAKSQQK